MYLSRKLCTRKMGYVMCRTVQLQSGILTRKYLKRRREDHHVMFTHMYSEQTVLWTFYGHL